ncbi:MAG: hypothetical protein ABJQ29_01290 [Luteolibacter sp.]
MKKSSSKPTEKDHIPTAEWVVAGIGLVLLCLSLGFLLYKAVVVDDGAPSITLKVEQVVPQDSGGLVLAEVTNTGGVTFTRLQIMGTSGNEKREVEIDYLPARSSRKFGVFFSKVPEKSEVRLSAGGYQNP